MLIGMEVFGKEQKVTSELLASSANVNPVVIRRAFGQLKDGGLIKVEKGVGGASLARPAQEVTLLDVFRATESVEGDLFGFHAHPNEDCPVGRNVHAVLDEELAAAQTALEGRLAQTTLADLLDRLAACRAREDAEAPSGV